MSNHTPCAKSVAGITYLIQHRFQLPDVSLEKVGDKYFFRRGDRYYWTHKKRIFDLTPIQWGHLAVTIVRESAK